MKKQQLIAGLVVLVALVALFFWGRPRFPFDFGLFRHQLAMANWGRIALGIVCIYVAYVFRSVRWAYLLQHNKKYPPFRFSGHRSSASLPSHSLAVSQIPSVPTWFPKRQTFPSVTNSPFTSSSASLTPAQWR